MSPATWSIRIVQPALLQPGSVQLAELRVAVPVPVLLEEDVQPELDYEKEEERFLEVLAPFVSDGRALVRVVEDGTLQDLERALLVDTYDVVHLTGHG
ncbi:hypothetical protein [Nannocystis bainbridge]|uniref:CHAT domain-containing protein n=1 Tax=Nannocystis bainbridge TaxID=2995303 RepID=A0ABT5DR77_9BACT|nr:hypothetical protein [Nannocystis bainbridge]MDC0716155.1 hypothetical protein [Nannocystis bainbridge]